MKKSLFLAVVLLLSSFVGISAKDWAFFSRYADENAVVEKLPESQRRVVAAQGRDDGKFYYKDVGGDRHCFFC